MTRAGAKARRLRILWQEASGLYRHHMMWAKHWPAPNGLDLRQAQAVLTAYSITAQRLS